MGHAQPSCGEKVPRGRFCTDRSPPWGDRLSSVASDEPDASPGATTTVSIIDETARVALSVMAWWGRFLTTGTLCAHSGLSAGYKDGHEQQKAG